MNANYIGTVDDFRSLRADWNRLARSRDDMEPFDLWEWSFTAYQTYLRGRATLFIIVLSQGNDPKAIAPLRMARGVQNKVLEAMSMSLPVVASPQASQGLGDVPPSSLCVADGVEQTIEGVSKWFADPDLARRDGVAAGEWVRRTWRWERMYERLDALLEELGVRLGPG